jgi:pyridoxal phosphate enzyme (YggS family)
MTILTQRIKENIERVQMQIAGAAKAASRQSEEIRLVVVTKAQPVEVLKAAVEAGASILGENYAEESVRKIATLGGKLGVEWHMIGHVQSRKAKLVIESFDLVHSLDSLKLAQKYSQLLAEKGQRLKVLLEFNVSGEEAKSGWVAEEEDDLEKLIPELEQVTSLPHLEIQGLMTMPPLFEDPQKTLPYFRKLRQFRDYLSNRLPSTSWEQLSMGTSADFEAAIREGATMIRVGRAILGPRHQPIVSTGSIMPR